MFLNAAAAVGLALMQPAHADPAITREAVDRMEEVLLLRSEDGLLTTEMVGPLIVVSATPRYEDSAEWFETRVLEALGGVYGEDTLRLCSACTLPRTYVDDGRLEYTAGVTSISEVVRLDDRTRGAAPPARAGVWLAETPTGVSVRVVELSTGRVLFAQNIDPDLSDTMRTARSYTRAEELERRARGDSLTQSFVDVGLVPGQHVSLDWTDQWGRQNRRLSGVSLSLFDPVLGVGAAHHRVTRLFNTTVGAKVLLSLPTAVVQSVSDGGDQVLDPLVTAAGVVRVPIGRSNYGVLMAVSTNGQVGFGISLLNVSFLPFLP
ncbi:MAG TPA: hypothetical protein DFR83_13285 [Deltaproteobacteria bacterium]|nr:hypothetical protein [Deltaproteobacteria bacterium]